MKKMLFLLVILLVTVSSAAAITNSGLAIKRVYNEMYAEPGDSVMFNVETLADENSYKENVKVRAYIMELGEYASEGPFDLGINSHKSRIMLYVPEDAGADEYLVRVSVSNDGTKRIKHRWIVVE